MRPGRIAAATITLIVVVGVAVLLLTRTPADDSDDRPTAAAGRAFALASREDLRPPPVRLTVRAAGAGPGMVFVAPKNGPSGQQSGPMIVDDRGRLVWFHPSSNPKHRAYDFRAQTYRGKPVITWWEGTTRGGHGKGEGVIYDDRYREVARVDTGNGIASDFHEFLIGPDDTAWLISYPEERRDLRAIGGTRDDTLVNGVIQQIDVATGKVLFEWKALDHIPFSDSYAKPPKDPRKAFDPVHLNSIAIEQNGTIIVSARETSTLYEIDPRSGRIKQRIGGKRPTLKMAPGTAPAFQHDARQLPDGTITYFDNRAASSWVRGTESRGVVLDVDRRNRRVRLVRSIPSPRGFLAKSQANMQGLPNGNLFFGWGGGAPEFNEIDEHGDVVWEATFGTRRTDTYRAYKHEWSGRPAGDPDLVADGDHLVASWNGATDVASWRLRAGTSDEPMRAVGGPVRWTGFETRLPRPADATRMAVEALDADGKVIGRSDTVG